jgi:hypothetical protein
VTTSNVAEGRLVDRSSEAKVTSGLIDGQAVSLRQWPIGERLEITHNLGQIDCGVACHMTGGKRLALQAGGQRKGLRGRKSRVGGIRPGATAERIEWKIGFSSKSPSPRPGTIIANRTLQRGHASDRREHGALLLDLCVSSTGSRAEGRRTLRSRGAGPWALALGPCEGKLVAVRKLDSSASISRRQAI